METELFQVREELSRLMLKNASTIRKSEGRSYLQSMAALKPIAPNSLREELQEITVRNDCWFNLLKTKICGYF